MTKPVKADYDDCYNNYIGKTFERLGKIKSLVPFAEDTFIKINGTYLKNIFQIKDEVEEKIKEIKEALPQRG